MDGQLQDGELFALNIGGPEVPHPTEANQTVKTIDRLALGQQQILFSELESWLLELGRFAEKLSAYEAPRGS